MKVINCAIISLLIFSCGEVKTEKEEDVPVVNFKEELAKNVSEYKTNNEAKVNLFKSKLDSIEGVIKNIPIDNVIESLSTPNTITLDSNFFIMSIHDYDTLDISSYKGIILESTDVSILRASTFKNTITQPERDLNFIDEYFTNTTSKYDSDEKKLSIFSAVTKRMGTYNNSEYVIIIKDYLYSRPEATFGSNFISGEVVSGVFLYDMDKNMIADQFLIRAMNSTHIQFKETGDLEKDKKSVQYKLNTGIKSNYDKELNRAIKERYSIKDRIHVFF